MEFNLLDFRKASGMTQKELSKKSGVSITTINKIEKRKGDLGNMATPKIIALCHALNVSIDLMIKGGSDLITIGEIFEVKRRFRFSNEQIIDMFMEGSIK